MKTMLTLVLTLPSSTPNSNKECVKNILNKQFPILRWATVGTFYFSLWNNMPEAFQDSLYILGGEPKTMNQLMYFIHANSPSHACLINLHLHAKLNPDRHDGVLTLMNNVIAITLLQPDSNHLYTVTAVFKFVL